MYGLYGFDGGVASAEINMGKDSFTGEFYTSSWQEPHPFLKTMNFRKNAFKGAITYSFSISRTMMKEGVLGNVPVQVKIDEYPVYKLTDYQYKLTGPDSYGVEYYSIIDINVPLELAEKIKDAKNVAIRYEDARGIKYPYVFPESTLAEWKQVINATEWDILQAIENKKRNE